MNKETCAARCSAWRGASSRACRGTTLLIILLLAGSCPGARTAAAREGGGERPAAYLQLGLGGREMALGGAADALRDSVAEAFYNPAGLTGVRTFQIQTQYAFLTEGRTLGAIAVGNRFEKSPFSYAMGWAFFSTGDIELRQGPSLEPLGTFGDTEMMFLLGLAYRINPRWHVGCSIKVFLQSLYNATGWGFGWDPGVLYRINRNCSVGLVITDPLSKLSFPNTESDWTPRGARLGVSRQFGPRWTAVAGLEYAADFGLRPRAGLEWIPFSGVAVRAGYGSETLRCGFGVTAKGSKKLAEEIQYTVQQDRIKENGLLHQVSVGLRFL